MTTIGAPGVVLERLAYDPTTWEAAISGHPDVEVFHGAAWLEFLARSQDAEPVVAVVRAGGNRVGYFVGAIVRRFGIRILGSPLRGWTTQSMGFLLPDGFDRRTAAAALVPFAFRDLRCTHVELADRHLTAEHMAGSGFVQESGRTFRIDLDAPEDKVFAAIQRTTRQEIRKAGRAGLRVDIASDDEFSVEFHRYLTAVFARQGLAPTYGLDRVRCLIGALQASGQILLLRASSPSGATLGTSISVGRNRTAVAWGMAFDRDNEDYHAIELLWWETIRYWKRAGALEFDLGGGGDYKAKYGGREVPSYAFHKSRYALLHHVRPAVRRVFYARQALAGWRAARGRAGKA